MNFFITLGLVLFTPYSPQAQGTSIATDNKGKSIRNIQSLNGRWHYIIDPYESGVNSRYFENRKPTSKSTLIEYDFEKSPTLNVPGDWNSQDDKLTFYEGTIWYEHDFNLEIKEHKRYLLYFGAVNYEADVYINGQKAGSHKGGFTPFQFDVTSLLHSGNNFIVVKANNTRKKENVPALDFDWWNYGGITRDVLLTEISPTFISDHTIQLAKNDSKVISGYIQITGEQLAQKVSIEIPAANIKTIVTTNDSGRAFLNIPVKNLNYWSPESPALYNVIITSGGDSVVDRIGFRTIETKGKDILLNGKPVFLRGVCLHAENPLIPGRPRIAAELKMLLEWAKELNCNFVRLAHYPHSEVISQLADSMGLMLWEEIPVYWSIDWTNPSTYDIAKQQLSELIARDKNRASVVIWSIGNETPPTDTRETFMEGLAAHARTIDNTRLLSAALQTSRVSEYESKLKDKLGDQLDLLSINEYAGWYYGKLSETDKYSFKTDAEKPVIISEFGGDALGGFHADTATRFSEEFQELLYQQQLKVISKIDGLRGTSPWILVDFRSPKRANPSYQNYWNRKGLISENGQKKKAFYIMKSYYDTIQKKYHHQ